MTTFFVSLFLIFSILIILISGQGAPQPQHLFWEYNPLDDLTDFTDSDCEISTDRISVFGNGGEIYNTLAVDARGFHHITFEFKLGVSNGDPLDNDEYARVQYNINHATNNWIKIADYEQNDLPVSDSLQLPLATDNNGVRIRIKNTGDSGEGSDRFYVENIRLTGTFITDSPTTNPTPAPTTYPTPAPTTYPTPAPTRNPTTNPTPAPTTNPTPSPTYNPTTSPTTTTNPTPAPTTNPTNIPTNPTTFPSVSPTFYPTQNPTINPTLDPSSDPTIYPTSKPSLTPTTAQPTTRDGQVPDDLITTLQDDSKINIAHNRSEKSFVQSNLDLLIFAVIVGVIVLCLNGLLILFCYKKRARHNKIDMVMNSMDSTMELTDVSPTTKGNIGNNIHEGNAVQNNAIENDDASSEEDDLFDQPKQIITCQGNNVNTNDGHSPDEDSDDQMYNKSAVASVTTKM